jgi:hypothetical protein
LLILTLKFPEVSQHFPLLGEIVNDPGFETEANHFENWNQSLELNPHKRKQFEDVENTLKRIETSQWLHFKKKMVRTDQTHPRRGLNQFFEAYNEAEAFSCLQDLGATDIKFVPESQRKSPDLYAKLGECDLYCEVKTINISDDDADRNAYLHNKVGLLPANYDTNLSEQCRKIIKCIEAAHTQIDSYDPNAAAVRYLYMVINAENPLAGRPEERLEEIKNFINSESFRPINIFIKLKPFDLTYHHSSHSSVHPPRG